MAINISTGRSSVKSPIRIVGADEKCRYRFPAATMSSKGNRPERTESTAVRVHRVLRPQPREVGTPGILLQQARVIDIDLLPTALLTSGNPTAWFIPLLLWLAKR